MKGSIDIADRDFEMPEAQVEAFCVFCGWVSHMLFEIVVHLRHSRAIGNLSSFMLSKPQKPNKAPEPTPTAVTPRAVEVVIEVKQWICNRDKARGAPAAGVAHLWRSAILLTRSGGLEVIGTLICVIDYWWLAVPRLAHGSRRVPSHSTASCVHLGPVRMWSAVGVDPVAPLLEGAFGILKRQVAAPRPRPASGAGKGEGVGFR
jgi:hypothetical protein